MTVAGQEPLVHCEIKFITVKLPDLGAREQRSDSTSIMNKSWLKTRKHGALVGVGLSRSVSWKHYKSRINWMHNSRNTRGHSLCWQNCWSFTS
jgi:hypothetical protein